MGAEEVKNTKKITKKQKAVLDFIEQQIDETGIAPTVRDICDGLGLSSPSTVHVHLKTLEEKGYIHRDPLKSRCITIVGRDQKPKEPELEPVGTGAFSDVVSLPVVGNVAAGLPILAEQNVTETIPLPVEIVPLEGARRFHDRNRHQRWRLCCRERTAHLQQRRYRGRHRRRWCNGEALL